MVNELFPNVYKQVILHMNMKVSRPMFFTGAWSNYSIYIIIIINTSMH